MSPSRRGLQRRINCKCVCVPSPQQLLIFIACLHGAHFASWPFASPSPLPALNHHHHHHHHFHYFHQINWLANSFHASAACSPLFFFFFSFPAFLSSCRMQQQQCCAFVLPSCANRAVSLNVELEREENDCCWSLDVEPHTPPLFPLSKFCVRCFLGAVSLNLPVFG